MSTSTLADLRNRRIATWNQAKAFLDSRREANDGVLSAEDAAAYERMEAHMDALDAEIARQERADRIDAALALPTNTALTTMPGAHLLDPDEPGKTGRASAEYRNAFWNAMRSRVTTREALNTLSVGTDTEGGYLAPDEFQTTLITALADENFMRGLAHVIQTSSGDSKIPVVSTHGAASWVAENGAVSDSDEVFSQVSLSAHKLATFLKVSEELINDSVFNIEGYLAAEFARRIGAAEEEAFMKGDGNNKPTGIFHTTGGAGVGVTAAKQAEITADEIIDLFYSLRAPYRKSAVWIMNDSTVKMIRKLKDTTGQYLWQPALTAGNPDTILGRPVHTSVFAPEIKAGARSVAFGDMSYYWIADRQGRAFQRLNELYAANGQIGFRATQRVDGKLILPEAVKVLAQKN